MFMAKHEFDDWSVRNINSDNFECLSTCNWFKALIKFIYLNFKYPKDTIELKHWRYYN